MEFFDDGSWKASGTVFCADDDCACGRGKISWGSGFLYVSPEIAVFRRIFRSQRSAEQEMHRRVLEKYGRPVSYHCKIGPQLFCKRAARKLNLDLDLASMDAKHWWETGKAPLRATPLEGSMESLEERLTRLD